MRSLPRIVSQIPSDVRNFLDRVREYLSEGGDSRFVTVKELKAGGVIGTTPAGTVTTPTDYTAVDPTIPTGLTTTGALASIIVEWTPANYLGHAYTEIWAAATNDYGAKVLVGTADGSIFSHSIGAGATRYYWIRFVNTAGVAGPFNSTSGTVGVTGQNPDYLIEVLSDAYGVAGPAPFFQLDSPTVINGVTIPAGTYIKQAWIADATISRAKIQDLAVDNAKINDLSAAKITAGTLQVGSYIQSQSYVAGTSGWKINSNGDAEFAQAVIRGSIYGGSATAYGTGTGLFSGLDSAVYKFRVGNPSGNQFTWDGTTLTVTGTISGGTILGGSATAYGTGTGFFAGLDSGVYKWRVGNPAGARIQWDGSAIYVYNTSNQVTIASGNIDYSVITGTKPPADADKTSANIAAGIAGQGIFATAGQLTSGTASTYIAGLALNTPQFAYDSATVFDVFTISTTTLNLPSASAYATATTTLIASLTGPSTDISTQRVILVSLRFTNYDTTPGWFELNCPNRAFTQDVGVRLVDGSNINNFTYICPITIAANTTSIGSITLTLKNGSTSASWWSGTAPDCQGNVVLLTRKR